MHAWKLTAGTIVKDGGIITGIGDLADSLRTDVRLANSGEHIDVIVGPLPDGTVPLDPSVTWSLNAWLRQSVANWNHRHGTNVAVESTYIPTARDIPARAKQLMAMLDASPSIPNLIY